MIAQTLRRAEDGKTDFAPFGRLGRTYIVPPEREAHLTNFLRTYYIAVIAGAVVAAQWLHEWVLALAPLAIAVLYLKYWHFVRHLPISEVPFQATSFESHSPPSGKRRSWVSVFSSTLLALAGAWMITARGGWAAYVVTAFFVVCLCVAIAARSRTVNRYDERHNI